MTLTALLSLTAFVLGTIVGVWVYNAVVEHFVRTDGQFSYKWNGRWYKVQGRRK